MGAVLTLVGRMVDIAANLIHLDIKVPDIERQRIHSLAQQIARIRRDLEAGRVPREAELVKESDSLTPVPLLRELEATVSLIPDAFVGSQSMRAYAPPDSPGEAPATLFRPRL